VARTLGRMSERRSLAGRTVIVTGGGSGIGRATAVRAAREGASVAVLELHSENAEETAEMVRADAGTAGAYPCDVSDDGSVARTVGAANDDLGRISGVVTAAGIFHGPDLRPAHEVSVEDFTTVLKVNLIGTFAVVKHALPHLMEGGGAIVTIASTAAIRGHGYGAGYTASKGGVDALTRLLAVQYGPHGVRANCICPGGVDTPMTGGTFATPQALERARRSVPLGRYAQPEDIGDVAVFLLGDDARHLTGSTLAVEGGATIA
jgi:NAD(P)-dependent dehydrogenase (short-subunit alcohol dehydrogenase family)